MSKLKWNEFVQGEQNQIPKHIELNISCNSAEKPGATDKAMNEFIERLGCDE